jgi:hypothetical protein
MPSTVHTAVRPAVATEQAAVSVNSMDHVNDDGDDDDFGDFEAASATTPQTSRDAPPQRRVDSTSPSSMGTFMADLLNAVGKPLAPAAPPVDPVATLNALSRSEAPASLAPAASACMGMSRAAVLDVLGLRRVANEADAAAEASAAAGASYATSCSIARDASTVRLQAGVDGVCHGGVEVGCGDEDPFQASARLAASPSAPLSVLAKLSSGLFDRSRFAEH